MTKKRSKFNQIAISIIMGSIIVAFVFTGVQSFTNNPNDLASVDGTPITVTEYNRALNRTLEYWTKINQGKSLTQKEIRQRGIREQVLQQLVSQKMMLNFAGNMKFDAGKSDIKDTITGQYAEFKTNNKFDVNKYKRILKLNGIPYKKFEEDVIDQVKMNKLSAMIEAQENSDTYSNELMKFKNATAKVNAVSFAKEKMTKFLKVSKSEIDTFLKESKSKAIIASLYETYKAQTKDKKVKTLEQKQSELAADHLKRTKRDALKDFNTELENKLETAFNKNNWKEVNKLAKKYELNFQKSAEINLLNTRLPNISFNEEKLTKILVSKNTSEILKESTPLTVSLFKAVSFKNIEPKKEEKEQFLSFSKNSSARSINFKILELQKKKSKVEQLKNLF